MAEEGPDRRGFVPLVPPRADGPMAALEMQQRAVDMVLAANRLAVSWLQQASQPVSYTHLTLPTIYSV